MTTKFEEKLHKTGQKIALTFDEREAMRARLLSRIAHSEKPVVSPYSPMFYWQQLSVYIKPQYVSVALLTILIVGGISAAAEKSLPGETLYQVKTSVNENVLGLFAFSPQSKAQLHTELVVRRLEEVEKLAIAGKLNASTTAEAETKIDTNLAVIKDSVKQLENDNNSLAAADTSSKAESSLKAHEAILDTLADGNTSIQDVATKVGIQATALSLDRAGIDSRSTNTTLSVDLLVEQQKTAEEAISAMEITLASSTPVEIQIATLSVAPTLASTSIIATTTATTTDIVATTTDTKIDDKNDDVVTGTADTAFEKAQIKLKYATDLFAQGKARFEEKNYGEAFVLLKKAEKIALEARLILQVGDMPEILPVSADTATSTATSTPTTSTPSIATTTVSAI